MNRTSNIQTCCTLTLIRMMKKKRKKRKKKEKQRVSLRVSVCVWEYCDHYRFLPSSHIAIRRMRARKEVTSSCRLNMHFVRRWRRRRRRPNAYIHSFDECILNSFLCPWKNDTFLWYLPTLQKCIYFNVNDAAVSAWRRMGQLSHHPDNRGPSLLRIGSKFWFYKNGDRKSSNWTVELSPSVSVPSDCRTIFSGHQNVKINFFQVRRSCENFVQLKIL